MIIDQLVNEHYDCLNDNDLYIWNYILNHKKECESLSIIELAKKCNVSRTTILRFTKKLSLSGYGEFKAYLKLDNKEEYKSINNVEKVCNAYNTVINGIKKKDCTEIFQLLDSAKNIYAFGEGMIQSSIKTELKRNFLLGGKILYDCNGRDELEIIEDMATEEDLFIMISVSGENEYILELSKNLRIKNIPIISITKSNCNSLAQMSTHNLYVSSVSFPQPLSKLEYQSLTSYFILIEILLLKYIEYRERLEERGKLI